MTDTVQATGSWVLTTVSLTIEKPDLDPRAVSAALGIEPTSSRLPGPSRWRPADDTNGLWMLECDQRTAKGPAEQLAHLLSLVESKTGELGSLRATDHQVHLEIRGYAGDGATFVIPHTLLTRIMHLGIPLKVIPKINER
ncbi:DUF4279 domain-containing protein [Streptomyces abikoensis]|nr:DUF4279 domain-containing protein [Streptomyces luteoverticillatus]